MPPLGNVWNIGAFSGILWHLLTNFRDSEKEFSAHTSVFHWNYSSALCRGMVGGIPSRKIDNSMQQCSALAWYRPIQILRMGKSLAAHGLGWHSRHYQCGDYDKAWTEAGRVLFTVVPVWNKTLSTTLILFTFLLVLEKKTKEISCFIQIYCHVIVGADHGQSRQSILTHWRSQECVQSSEGAGWCLYSYPSLHLISLTHTHLRLPPFTEGEGCKAQLATGWLMTYQCNQCH